MRVLDGSILFATLLAACGPGVGSIGAVLRPVGGALRVEEAPAGLAGARGGLQIDDEVTHIDGADVREMSPTEIRHRLQGPVGSKVRLTIVRRERVEELIVERAPYRRLGCQAWRRRRVNRGAAVPFFPADRRHVGSRKRALPAGG
jgi:C-terminal processing protease CtpA/Prc